jgi:hypothetical protein
MRHRRGRRERAERERDRGALFGDAGLKTFHGPCRCKEASDALH